MLIFDGNFLTKSDKSMCSGLIKFLYSPTLCNDIWYHITHPKKVCFHIFSQYIQMLQYTIYTCNKMLFHITCYNKSHQFQEKNHPLWHCITETIYLRTCLLFICWYVNKTTNLLVNRSWFEFLHGRIEITLFKKMALKIIIFCHIGPKDGIKQNVWGAFLPND